MEKLAYLGGNPLPKVEEPADIFKWPIITDEDRHATMDVVERNAFSGTDITEAFEKEFAEWLGMKHCVAVCNGTMSLLAAMFGVGLGAGDEIICPTKTYWASCLSAQLLGASVVFANIVPNTLGLDPKDLERCLSPRTKAIMVVHYMAHPVDMDPVMEFAKKHNLKVIEDVSHAQGGLYKGRRLGTIGDVGAMSLMSGKSFAAGELGALVTNNVEIYERALAFSHYERNDLKHIKETEYLKPFVGLPLSGLKGRVNQTCSAAARVQLKYYDERTAEIRKAMNYFFDQLSDLPGIHPIRVDESEGSNMAGWYVPGFTYRAEELGGLDVNVFCAAVKAEIGRTISAGGNFPLHTHRLFKEFDLTNIGKPTRIAFADRDVRETDAGLAPSEKIMMIGAPWFKKLYPEYIDYIAAGFRKVALNADQLLDKKAEKKSEGRWYGTENE